MRRVISIVIPVKDGGEDLRRCLWGIARQRVDEEVEVIVVDSASKDASVALADAMGARVYPIAAEEFNHGGTRNLGVSHARGEVVVFTSQDAYAPGEDWLTRLTAPVRTGAVAGAYGRQLAHEGASAAEQYFLDFLYGPTSREQSAATPHELTMDATLFSNVNAAIRTDVMHRYPFAEDVIMSEDQEWSRRVLLDGQRLAYVAEAVVRHSHAYTLRAAFKRFFDSGVSSEQAYMAGGSQAAAVLRRRAFEYARGELSWLWRHHRSAIPYAALYEGAKFAGLQLGLRHEHLPSALKPRLSALPAYWTARR